MLDSWPRGVWLDLVGPGWTESGRLPPNRILKSPHGTLVPLTHGKEVVSISLEQNMTINHRLQAEGRCAVSTELSRFDRIRLHLRCLLRDHKYRWHLAGVWRELLRQ